MKTREIEANVKILDDAGNVVNTVNAKGSYQEPENVSEFMSMKLSDDEKLRIICYGLNTIKQSELRSQNNFGPIVKKLVEAGFFKTHKEAFEHLIALKNYYRGQ
jgi:hypothetical protein